jgi:hypothetical protein
MTTKKLPKSRPTYFSSAKISPNSLGDLIRLMLKNAIQNGEIVSNLVTLTFVESINTFIQSHTFIQSSVLETGL